MELSPTRTGCFDLRHCALSRGVEHIIHAGDVGRMEVLEELARIAPVSAVLGNVDNLQLPETLELQFDGARIFVIHDRGALMPSHGHLRSRVVIFGHSHKPLVEERDGTLWLNPGSAGPVRFRLPVTLAMLDTTTVRAEIIRLL